jgi:DNA-binding response OmpR family regulator
MRHTVLYIEDDPSSAHLLELLFMQRPGIRLLTASAGRQGLELARAERPSLILLDFHLQDMDGNDVLEPALNATPVILLTAEQYPRLPEHLRALGAQAYLMKPLDLAQLLALVDTSLAGPVE